jgi:PAS domain-containing protein
MDARDSEPPNEAPPAHRAAPGDVAAPLPGPGTLERRRRPPPATPAGVLEAIPARVLLNRLSTAMLAVGLDGMVVYANPACEHMLGHHDANAMEGCPLSAVLADHVDTAPRDCVALLKVTGSTVIDFCDAAGFRVRTVISTPLLLREDDPLLLVSITDVTDLLWMTRRA